VIERADVGDVAVVRLVHGKVNALDLELVRTIAEAFTDLDRDPAARSVVLTGSDGAFSAGVDLNRVVSGGADYVHQFLPGLVAAFLAVFRVGKPVVAAVNGHAIAGGAILVSACDHRLMASGRIGVTELRVGVPFPVAALEILGFAMGATNARSAALDGGTYDPTHAARIGFVDEVVAESELLDRAVGQARTLADTIAADAFRHTKQLLHRDVEERIARWSPDDDAEAARIWAQAAVDGRITRFMTAVVGRRR